MLYFEQQANQPIKENMAARMDGSSAQFNTHAYPNSHVLVANNSVVNVSEKSKQPKEGKFRSILFCWFST